MRWVVVCSLSLTLLASGGLVARASAQEAATDASASAEARRYFERGIELANAESWAEALEAFRGSLARLERAATRLNIGAALLRLGRFIEARAEMDVLLASSTIDAGERARATDLRARASEGIRVLELHVEPSDAVLSVDGVVREGVVASGRLELDPGRHRLEVRAAGHATETREIEPGLAAILVRLAPLPALLHVRSDVEGAAIAIDGEARGTTPADLELAPGRHQLIVTARELRPYERWLSLTSGQELEITAALAEPSGGDLLEDPWFWAIGGITVAVLAGVGIGLGVGLSSPGYDGGTVGDVLRPR